MSTKTFSDGVYLPASDINTYLANSGLVYVTSVTIPASPAVTNVDVLNCFSSSFDSYLIVANGIIANGAGQAGSIFLMNGTTPVANGCYGNTFYVANGGSGGLTNSPQVGSAIFEGVLCAGTNNTAGEVWINSPYLAKYTTCNFMNVDDSYMRMGTYVHRNAASYNGFRLNFGAGTVTNGTVVVYGARKP